jgi:hypothetical protein
LVEQRMVGLDGLDKVNLVTVDKHFGRG